MIPSLQPLCENDKVLIDHFVAYVETNSLWDEMNGILDFVCKSAPVIIAPKLKHKLCGLSNALFNYIVKCCRESPLFQCPQIQSHMQTWALAGVGEGKKYRFAWVLIDNGEVLLLNKSSLYYDSISDCLSCGWRYQPSLDYPESPGCCTLLTYEVSPGGAYALPNHDSKVKQWYLGDNRGDKSIICKGTAYTYAAIKDYYVIKMPWYIQDGDSDLYIYYIKKFDTWHYSLESDIVTAHHHTLHH